MKFVCNNCGFTADISVRRTNCPMCGSSNVSFSADTLILPENEDEENNKVDSGKIASASAKSCKKCGRKSCKCKILTVVVILILAALAAFFFLK